MKTDRTMLSFDQVFAADLPTVHPDWWLYQPGMGFVHVIPNEDDTLVFVPYGHHTAETGRGDYPLDGWYHQSRCDCEFCAGE